MSAPSIATPDACDSEFSFDSLGAGASCEVFEFFAGLGGFHVSLPAGLVIHSITAVEIDRRAAACYEFNLHRPHTAPPTDGAATSAGEAAPAATMSVKARMKANRKIFFQKQKEAAEAAARAKQVESEKNETATSISDATLRKDSTEDVASSPPLVSAPAEAATAAAPAAAPRRAITSTPISSFAIPASSSARDDVIHSAQPARLLLRLIEQLPASALVSSTGRPCIWLMSPPCQPFTHTKNAKQLGSRDPRNAAFEFLCRTLRQMEHARRPAFIALENVKHFYASDMHAVFMDTLQECGYHFTQYMLSPMQIGVPNHRTRYYAAAEKLTHQQAQERTPEQWLQMRAKLVLDPPGYVATPEQQAVARALAHSITEAEVDAEAQAADLAAGDEVTRCSPDAAGANSSSPTAAAVAVCEESLDPMPSPSDLPVLVAPSPLAAYLDSEPCPSASLVLTGPQLGTFRQSVVTAHDRRTFCFTGAYGKIINTSSGSFLLFQGAQVDRAQSLTAHPLDKTAGWAPYVGSIRFFSPMELLRLFGFPAWYRFPPQFAVSHCYKLVGNSINVTVVQGILRRHLARLCAEDTPSTVRVPTR